MLKPQNPVKPKPLQSDNHYLGLMEIIKNRRTIRRFAPKAVPMELIRKAIDAARWAPSACNRQLWEFIIVDDPNLIQKIDKIVNQKSNNGIYVLVFYDFTKALGGANHEEIQSASMAVQNFMLAAHTLGLGTKLRGGLGDIRQLQKLVGVPEWLKPVTTILVGYPAENPTPPKRRALEDIIHINRYTGEELYPVTTNLADWSIKNVKLFRETLSRYGGELNKRPQDLEQNIAAQYSQLFPDISGVNLFLFPYNSFFIEALLKNDQGKDSKNIINVFAEESKKLLESLLPSEVHIDIGNGIALEYPDCHFDSVWWMDEITHHPQPLNVIREVERILPIKGRLFLSFSNSRSVLGKIHAFRLSNVRLSDSYLWNIGPERRYSLKEVKKLCENTKLEISKITGIRLGMPESLGKLKTMAYFIQNIADKFSSKRADLVVVEFAKRIDK